MNERTIDMDPVVAAMQRCFEGLADVRVRIETATDRAESPDVVSALLDIDIAAVDVQGRLLALKATLTQA